MYVKSERHSRLLLLWTLLFGCRMSCRLATRTVWWYTTVGLALLCYHRTIYLGYDLSFTHCIDKVYQELNTHFSHILKGEVIHSQNLSYSESFGTDYIRFGYHYFNATTRDPNGILVFLCKDEANVTDYYANGNLYSVLLDSGLSQACVYTDSHLVTVVLILILFYIVSK